jgi:hypothetical protein
VPREARAALALSTADFEGTKYMSSFCASIESGRAPSMSDIKNHFFISVLFKRFDNIFDSRCKITANSDANLGKNPKL